MTRIPSTQARGKKSA